MERGSPSLTLINSATVNVVIDLKDQGISVAEATIIHLQFQVIACEGVSAGALLGPSPILGIESAESGTAQLIFAVLEDAPSGEHGLTVYRVGLAYATIQEVSLVVPSHATVKL